MSIEVRVSGRGVVCGDRVLEARDTSGLCGVCGEVADTVASIGEVFACKACLRDRLEAMTLATWRLNEPSALPWGKSAG